MKLPGRVRSFIDELGLSSSQKSKLLRHLGDIADSLPEHPSPAEVKRIVNGALKATKIVVGDDSDSDKGEEKKEKKKEKKAEKKEKEEVKESLGTKLSFKAFLESRSIVYKRDIMAAAKKVLQSEKTY